MCSIVEWRRYLLPIFLFGASSAAEPGRELTPVRQVAIPSAGEVIKAELGTDETVHVVYNTPDGPRYVFSTNQGAIFSNPLEVVDAKSKLPGLVFDAWDLAVSPNGTVHIAMGNNAWKLKLPQEQWSFHYASRLPGAQKFEAVRNLNMKPSEGYSLAATGNEVAAAFLSDKLFAMFSSDEGRLFRRLRN
jgi:hypothetical protein